MIASYIVVIGYACLVIGIGIIGMRRTKTFRDFLLGGGKVGPWMSAFSYGTAYFSAVLFIGFAGKIGWSFGLSGLWIAAGNALIGVLVVWAFLGKRIRSAALQYQAQTMPELLKARYDSPFLKIYTSLAIFIFFIPYTAAVFMGLSYLFTSNFNMRYEYMLMIMGLFTAIYMVLGGYKAMAMIDVIFGMIMTVGVVVLLISCLHAGGGLDAIIHKLAAIDKKLIAPVGPPGFWALFSLVFLTSVAPMAMPQMIQKFYAIKDDRSIRIGMVASTFFAILVSGTAYFTGALTRVFINPAQNPKAFITNQTGIQLPDYDALMPELLTTVIPPALSSLILLLVLAASMSTLAALVLISSSTIVKDLYAGFFNTKASDQTLTLLMRVLSLVFIMVSVFLAFLKPGVIVTILTISWGAIAAVFLGPFIWGILSVKTTKSAAIIASIGGLTLCIILFIVGGAAYVPQAGTIGMLFSLVTPPLISSVVRH